MELLPQSQIVDCMTSLFIISRQSLDAPDENNWRATEQTFGTHPLNYIKKINNLARNMKKYMYQLARRAR